MTSQPSVKYFTVEEANRAIPYVQRIVEDIIREYEQWCDGIHRYEVLAANSRADEGESEEQVQVREGIDAVARRINSLIGELSDVGCVFKGFDGGLVDFYGRRNGRDVFLCWKLGEPEVLHWHELDGGFAGRKALFAERVEGGPDA